MIPFSIFPMQDVIMVSIQEEIDDTHIAALVEALSSQVRQGHVRYVIIDLHEVEAVDTFLAGEIEKLASMLYLQRASTIVVGLSVPVVLTLLDFGIRLKGVEFALDVAQALERISHISETGTRYSDEYTLHDRDVGLLPADMTAEHVLGS